MLPPMLGRFSEKMMTKSAATAASILSHPNKEAVGFQLSMSTIPGTLPYE